MITSDLAKIVLGTTDKIRRDIFWYHFLLQSSRHPSNLFVLTSGTRIRSTDINFEYFKEIKQENDKI